MTPRQLFKYLEPLIHSEVEAVYPGVGCCILATRIAIEVANYFGIFVSPLAVRLVAYNRVENRLHPRFRVGVIRQGSRARVIAASRTNSVSDVYKLPDAKGIDVVPERSAGLLYSPADQRPLALPV